MTDYIDIVSDLKSSKESLNKKRESLHWNKDKEGSGRWKKDPDYDAYSDMSRLLPDLYPTNIPVLVDSISKKLDDLSYDDLKKEEKIGLRYIVDILNYSTNRGENNDNINTYPDPSKVSGKYKHNIDEELMSSYQKSLKLVKKHWVKWIKNEGYNYIDDLAKYHPDYDKIYLEEIVMEIRQEIIDVKHDITSFGFKELNKCLNNWPFREGAEQTAFGRKNNSPTKKQLSFLNCLEDTTSDPVAHEIKESLFVKKTTSEPKKTPPIVEEKTTTGSYRL